LAGCLLLALAGCGPGSPKNTLEKVKREGKLVVATHPVNPPFEFGAGTGVDGFDYDLTEAIARGLGVKTQWIKKQFEQCFEYLQNGEVDMVVNAVTITPEREVKSSSGALLLHWPDHRGAQGARTSILCRPPGKKVGVRKLRPGVPSETRQGEWTSSVRLLRQAPFELNRLLDAVGMADLCR
jgi:hypothetical protein